MPNIVLNSISPPSVVAGRAGQVLTCSGSNMSATDIVYFKQELSGTVTQVPATSGTSTQVVVNVPTTLVAAGYVVYLTTGMGSGESGTKPLIVSQPGGP